MRRAGFLFYLGMPSFFVDTTDIWMEPRKPRLLVSWAGPYSGFFLAGLASLLTFVIPDQFIAGLLFQFASASALVSFFNLNPLLQLDGYYILMDWLEMPLLRARAISFVQSALWRKLCRHEAFGREERIFTIFGFLALAWTTSALWSTLRILRSLHPWFLPRLTRGDRRPCGGRRPNRCARRGALLAAVWQPSDRPQAAPFGSIALEGQ